VNVGSHIGQYRIVKKLGAGGMGAVYLGEHILLGRRAAIKTLLPALSKNREIAERFFNEARATSAISDPGVVQIFDFGYHVDGTAYIVLELLEGESLAGRIDRMGQLLVGESLRIARQVAASLSVAHEHGIVHRDLKPDNIFLIHDGETHSGERTKILDFGICMLKKDDVRITGSGVMVGTPVYMSPEQCRGNSVDIDHRSDIYALGCVLFHMLTGRAPFEHDAPGDFIVSHMQKEPPLASSLVPALPAMVDDILMRCLAKSPADRFQTMGDLQTALGTALDRISAPGIATTLARPALVLGAGYRSVYDANLGSAVATRNATPPQFDSVELATPKLRPSLLKFFAAAVVLLLVVGAVIVSRVEVGGTSAVAEPSYRYTTPVDTTAPRAPTHAPAVTQTDEAAPFPELDDTVEPSAAPAQEVHQKKVHKPKPKPRAIRRKAPSRQTPEDLYDTR
jgi:serine/threonine protein kinase